MLKYIKLGKDKKPIEKLTAGGHPREEVEDWDNLGVLIPEPMVVFDFDTPSESEIMLKIVEDLDIHCLAMKTTRGVHLWFKSPKVMKNSIKTRCAIGLHYDVRSHGKLCFSCVKKDGEWREWLRTYRSEEIEEVPAWLTPLSYGKTPFKGMTDGCGRNQALYEYILIMQSKGYSREEIRETIRIINSYVFADPLPESEIATILRDDAFKDEAELQEVLYFDGDMKFKHELFAKALMTEFKIICLHDMLYIYDNGCYVPSEIRIQQRMIEKYPNITDSKRMQVLKYLKIVAYIDPESIDRQEFIMSVENTRLDVRTGQALPFDSESITFSKLPVEYNPSAYSPDLDKCLNAVFCNNKEVIMLFEEIVGYCLIKNCKFRKGFLFYGGGSNGKSTILNMLKCFFGERNVSAIELEKLDDKFKTAELENKLVNIGDDINRADIENTGTLKKLFTGESVMVERKGKDPFVLKSYAKQIFSCNEIPRIADKSAGMYSRLVLIPFNAKFDRNDEDFDPFIEEKITSPESLSYLLNKALTGLKRLLTNNGFTEPASVTEALMRYKRDNSTVLTWIEEEGITFNDLTSYFTHDLFSMCQDWCARNCIKFGASIRTFHKEIEEKYNLERIRSRAPDGKNNSFSWKFVTKLD